MAKIKRAKKESAIKQAMSGCLVERGHNVVDWAKVDRKSRKPRPRLAAAA
jgi:hypothetical protein